MKIGIDQFHSRDERRFVTQHVTNAVTTRKCKLATILQIVLLVGVIYLYMYVFKTYISMYVYQLSGYHNTSSA